MSPLVLRGLRCPVRSSAPSTACIMRSATHSVKGDGVDASQIEVVLPSCRMARQKDPNAAALGKKGGKARAKRLSAEERREAARKAAQARWQRRKAGK
jgi:hypothetical protein